MSIAIEQGENAHHKERPKNCFRYERLIKPQLNNCLSNMSNIFHVCFNFLQIFYKTKEFPFLILGKREKEEKNRHKLFKKKIR